MKCDELTPLVFSINDLAFIYEPAVRNNFENPHDHAFYKATEVDDAIAELKRKLQDQCISCPVKMQEDDVIAQIKQKIEEEREFGLNRAKNADYEIGKLYEKILVLEKSYKKLVKRFVHETSVAESYRSLVYKEDALKYQKVGNSEMYEELSKRSDKAYRHANRWRRIFRKMSQEEYK